MELENLFETLEALNTRLERLERNHLALAAEHTALWQFTRALIGFIEVTPESAARRLPVFREKVLARTEDFYLDPTDFRALFEMAWEKLEKSIPPKPPIRRD